MKLNTIYNQDCIVGMRSMPDNCADLIIADPPYFETKGAFDFIWPSFDDYLQDVEKWAAECFRILKPNGTLYWWGHAKKIAYTQVVLDKFFTLENSLVWQKKNGVVLKNNPSNMRSFAPITERCLMYSNEKYFSNKANDKKTQGMTAENRYKYESGLLHTRLLMPVIDYLISEREKAGFTNKQIDDALNTRMATRHWFCQTSQFALPTVQNYQRLRDLFNSTGGDYLNKEYDELREEYEELRNEYKELLRPFDMRGRLLTDVLTFSQETHITKNYDHDTKKPETLTRELILTSSRAGDLVVVPFAGSGTECAMAKKEGRNFIGFDIEPKYVEMSNKRVDNVAVNSPTFQFDTKPNSKSAI